MNRPFIQNVKVCPHCNSTNFVKFDHQKNRGFHPLSRFYCLNHGGAFWKSKDEEQLTTGQQGQKVSRQRYSSDRRFTERRFGRGGRR